MHNVLCIQLEYVLEPAKCRLPYLNQLHQPGILSIITIIPLRPQPQRVLHTKTMTQELAICKCRPIHTENYDSGLAACSCRKLCTVQLASQNIQAHTPFLLLKTSTIFLIILQIFQTQTMCINAYTAREQQLKLQALHQLQHTWMASWSKRDCTQSTH